MNIYQINIKDSKEFLKNLKVQGAGVEIMSKKMELLTFFIKDLKTPAVNILKQDALSIGAELAVPSGVILCQDEYYDSLLIGTKKQIEILSQKELSQPFGLKKLAKELREFLKTKEFPTQIMGVINANDDSFFAGSRFRDDRAIFQIEEMIENGADIIDIGAVSSRPNADIVEVDEELERIKYICDIIKKRELYKKVSFSIDSFNPKVIKYALESGFNIINDITGARDDEVIKLAIDYNAKLCIMHMQGTPQTMQQNPTYSDVMIEISDFFQKQIQKCEKLGLSRDNIILDVGIGFGKKLEHNLTLIRNMKHFKKFGCPILVGASRKSMIDHIVPTPIEERLSGTLSIHLKSLENGASIIRCHDVKEHFQAIKVWERLS
jgi:dihydropteroate synthase